MEVFMPKRVRSFVASGIIVATILLAILIPKYYMVMLHSNEAVLKSNLLDMRKAIDSFTADKRRAPKSLQELVEAGYFRTLPTDPMTRSNSSWKLAVGTPGITDVHSGSGSVSSDGTTYDTW
jgi:general secretion pathway protein G